jgi:hypothetical protein
MAMKDGYPFIFQMNDRSVHDELLEYTLQYRFKSTKSNRTYIVRVERYANHSYCGITCKYLCLGLQKHKLPH